MKAFAPSVAGPGFALGLCIALAGCSSKATDTQGEAPTPVQVSRPVEREVTDYTDFTARIAAVDAVEVRARVWGYLDKVNFKEGALVKKGEVLFEVDPRIYRAQFEANKAEVAQRQASLALAKANNERFKAVFKENPGAVTILDLDKYAAEEAQAVANLDLAKANVDSAKLNLDWTKVASPISGRISKYNLTVGNLVQSGQQGGTLLTTIVSVDPVYAYFDVDEHTVQQVRKLIREGKAKSARDAPLPVSLGLATEQGHPHQGTVDFVDNQVNPKTGTLRLRGVFPSKGEVLSPGYFARIRLPIGFAHKALLITDRAIDTDQGQKIVYVVDKENKVATRPIRVGARHDGLRVIEDGLKAGERILVTGLQQVRPGMVVEPKVVDMPSSNPKSETNPKQT